MSGGGGGDTQQEVINRPPPGFDDAFWTMGQQANQLLQNWNPQYYPGQSYVGANPYTSQGLNAMGQGAMDPNSGLGSAMNYYRGVMGGDYMGLNPAFRSAVMEPAMENVASRFEQAGRYGSPASVQSMNEAGMRALAPYYDAERTRMGQAANMLPQLEAQRYQQLLGAGQGLEGYDQQALQADMDRFNWEQNQELARLGQIAPLLGVGSGYGTTQSTAQQPGGSPIAGALGGGILGAQLAPLMGLAGPWGLVGGALLGGLLS